MWEASGCGSSSHKYLYMFISEYSTTNRLAWHPPTVSTSASGLKRLSAPSTSSTSLTRHKSTLIGN